MYGDGSPPAGCRTAGVKVFVAGVKVYELIFIATTTITRKRVRATMPMAM